MSYLLCCNKLQLSFLVTMPLNSCTFSRHHGIISSSHRVFRNFYPLLKVVSHKLNFKKEKDPDLWSLINSDIFIQFSKNNLLVGHCFIAKITAIFIHLLTKVAPRHISAWSSQMGLKVLHLKTIEVMPVLLSFKQTVPRNLQHNSDNLPICCSAADEILH